MRQVGLLDVYIDKPARPPIRLLRRPLQCIHLYVLISVALQDIMGILKDRFRSNR